MIDPLDGVLAKVGRAEEHFALLQVEVTAYLETKPFDLVAYTDRNRARVGFAVRVKEQPSLRMAVIFGDCLQNLRAALDYLAWGLVLDHGLTPSTENPVTRFPIYTSPVTEKGKQRRVDVPPGVDREALRLVEGFQPYHHGRASDIHPLAVLRELSNRDKHRTLNLAVGAKYRPSVTLITPVTRERITAPGRDGPAYDDDIIGIYQLPQEFPDLPSDWEVEEEGYPFVGLGEVGPWQHRPVQLIAADLLKFVRDTLVPMFRPLLARTDA
jgi:hypothetical protein